MRNVSDKIITQSLCSRQLFCHFIEILGDDIEITQAVYASHHRYPYRKVAFHYLLRGFDDTPHRPFHHKFSPDPLDNSTQQAEKHYIHKSHLGRVADISLCQPDPGRFHQTVEEQRHTAAYDKCHQEEKGQVPPDPQQHPFSPAGSLHITHLSAPPYIPARVP